MNERAHLVGIEQVRHCVYTGNGKKPGNMYVVNIQGLVPNPAKQSRSHNGIEASGELDSSSEHDGVPRGGCCHDIRRTQCDQWPLQIATADSAQPRKCCSISD